MTSTHRRERVGRFGYRVDTDTWWWSDEVYAIHGFARGEVVPTVDVLLAHTHPDDRPHTWSMLQACLRDGRPFGYFHRITDASGTQRWVEMVGDGVRDASGPVTGLRGYLIDLTEPQQRVSAETSAAAVREATASRAAIEQAKGALMLVYGLDPESAFQLLSWQSQRSNRKLRDLAEHMIAAAIGLEPGDGARQRIDAVLSDPPDRMAGHGRRAAAVTVRREDRDGEVHLVVGGEIDMVGGPRLEAALASAMTGRSAPDTPVLVDLTGVRHLGPAGVDVLCTYHRRCVQAGGTMRVVAADDAVAGALRLGAGDLVVEPAGAAAGRTAASRAVVTAGPGTSSASPPDPVTPGSAGPG